MNSIYTEYTNLTPDHIQWLDRCGAKWASGHKVSKVSSQYIGLHKEKDSFVFRMGGSTLIPTGDEFCEQVADMLGIDKPTFRNEIDGEYTPIEKIQDVPFGNKSSFVDEIIDQIASQPTYPHKTYRVLDSLEGIPLDTRIPLSEWIPPFLKMVLVITDDDQVIGQLTKIIDHEMWFYCKFKDKIIPLDGHWMRIV